MSGTFEERVRQTIQIMGEGWEHLSIRFSIIAGIAAVIRSRDESFNPRYVNVIACADIWEMVRLEKTLGYKRDQENNLHIFRIRRVKKNRTIRNPYHVLAIALTLLKRKEHNR